MSNERDGMSDEIEAEETLCTECEVTFTSEDSYDDHLCEDCGECPDANHDQYLCEHCGDHENDHDTCSSCGECLEDGSDHEICFDCGEHEEDCEKCDTCGECAAVACEFEGEHPEEEE